jgi:hypothetical protein
VWVGLWSWHPAPLAVGLVVVVLLIAYGQLLVATDTVRLYQSAVAPVMALGAAAWLPAPWLWLAVVLHVMWWRKPERI